METVSEILINDIGCESIKKINPIHGGCINESYCFITDKGPFFIKLNKNSESFSMFQGEMESLKEIQETNTIKTPKPYKVGFINPNNKNLGAFIIMEYIEFSSNTINSEKKLGKQLAEMHLFNINNNKIKQFGFSINNTIGSTPQLNIWTDNWIEFFKKYRLQYQLDLIKKNYQDKEIEKLGEKLIEKLPIFFEYIINKITPCLLHGDLWSGNWGTNKQDNPVIFDPASYYGHSEMELSIMNMFGGFSSVFFNEYHRYIPKEPGFEKRQKLYQLYHYLNHMNLFGSGYRNSCIRIMKNLLE